MNQANVSLTREHIDCLKALVPGTSVDLQISTPTSPKRVKTTYVGLMMSQCVIVQVPQEAKFGMVRDLLNNGVDVVVRYVLEGDAGQVIAFKAQVIRVLSNPVPMLLLTFPKVVQTIGLRAEKRLPPGIVSTIDIANEDKSHQINGLIVDVSNTGCRLAIAVAPEMDGLAEEQQITVTIPIEDDELKIAATVKNIKRDFDYVYYGLHFEQQDKLIDQLMERYFLQVE